jgi:Uma2 family endonuclease
MNSFTLDIQSTHLTDEQFFALTQANRDLRIERSAHGELTIMSPATSKTGQRNFQLAYQLGVWVNSNRLGVAFDSSTGFKLPNGAERAPDLSWVAKERWEALTEEEQDQFAPICPDFVIELRSKSDSLPVLQAKMREYIENGAKLGWLINPKIQTVEIYRPNQSVEVLENPTQLSGESILPGFVLNLNPIWDIR